MLQALIVDDERDICELIEMALMGQNIRCDSAYSVRSAIRHLKAKTYDLMFCDIRLPDGDGLDLLAYVQKHFPQTPICMITAHGNMDMAVRALRLGAFDFINKPFDIKQLRKVCRTALKQSDKGEKIEVQEETSARTGSHTQLIGNSSVMVQIRSLLEKVAQSQAPVFIHGESGTGKEVVAKSIHEQSSRKEGPFIAVNCGAIPENLVESEFFGYKKGAFTGANQDTDGLFVAANGGTLFLDEVADLPLAMQVKLLRAIQERAIRPIGASSEEAVDVRIISATHKDLSRCVQERTFREDLYYRLNVISVTLPALRDREGDISILAHYLLKRLADNAGYPQVHLSEEALEKLEAYSFPGNVRELENILERSLTFMEGDTVKADDIHLNASLHDEDKKTTATEGSSLNVNLFELAEYATATPYGAQETPVEEEHPWPDNTQLSHETSTLLRNIALPSNLETFLLEIERAMLLRAVKECHGNKTKAAERLGLSFRTVRYRLKKLGID